MLCKASVQLLKAFEAQTVNVKAVRCQPLKLECPIVYA